MIASWWAALQPGDTFYVDGAQHIVAHVTAYGVYCRCGGFYLRERCRPEAQP